jgi:hypothetical protein
MTIQPFEACSTVKRPSPLTYRPAATRRSFDGSGWGEAFGFLVDLVAIGRG